MHIFATQADEKYVPMATILQKWYSLFKDDVLIFTFYMKVILPEFRLWPDSQKLIKLAKQEHLTFLVTSDSSPSFFFSISLCSALTRSMALWTGWLSPDWPWGQSGLREGSHSCLSGEWIKNDHSRRIQNETASHISFSPWDKHHAQLTNNSLFDQMKECMLARAIYSSQVYCTLMKPMWLVLMKVNSISAGALQHECSWLHR